MNNYNSIVIGGGHNGLVCAAYLAQAGHSVLLLEAADQTGGLVAAREFHPDFSAAPAHSISHFSSKVSKDLGIACVDDGVAAALATIGLKSGADPVVLRSGELHGGSDNDTAAYASYRQIMRKHANALRPSWLKTMPRIGSTSLADLMTFAQVGLSLRRLGKKDMQEFLRVASLPARDLMDEYFEDDVLKAALSWDGLIGAKMAPRSPNSSVLAMLYRMSEQSAGDHSVPKGGMAALVDSLTDAATRFGVEVRTAAAVERILVGSDNNGLRTEGVRLRDGEEIGAERVISSVDPQRTLLGMVGVEYLDIEFTNRIRRLRCNGYVAKLHLALDGLPEFTGLERPDGRMIIAPEMDAIEFAFDDAKYGDLPAAPVMEITIPSVHDASLAPDGKHVLSAHVMYVPYGLKDGWTDAARDTICARAIDTIVSYAPGIRDQIIASEFLTPADLEQMYNVTGGHWHHTEFAMDQLLMMRPTYGAAQYRTPIPGLHLCGAGSHPGGDVTGAAGHNAAQEILR